MAVKRIDYTVYKGGTISPSGTQEGGVQGEHKATILRFTLDDNWYNNLRTQTDGYRLIYHFEAYDGAGGKHCSDTAVLTEKWADYPLENFLTRYGGLVRVTLVLSLVDIKTGTCEREQHSFKAELRLIFAPHANTDGDEYESMASLAEAAKANKQLAEKYANEAKEAQAGTEAAASVLKQGTTFVFNGGTADGEVDADLIVDEEMSDYSSNPVQNRVIKGYVDEKDKELSDKIDSLYPVGSIWIGGKDKDGNPINPKDVFGGTWVRKKVKKTISGLTSISVSEGNTIVSVTVNISDDEIIVDGNKYCIVASPVSGSPETLISVGGVETFEMANAEPEDSGGSEKYIYSFNIFAKRTAAIDFPACWIVVGNSYSDENGYYHWQRTE